jgi:cytochrome c oxidase cbb3-type subunit 3
LARGREIYNFRCYFCHGYSGDAKTLASTYLIPKPRNFVVSTAADLSRKKMIDAVTHGRVKTAMRGFKTILSGEEISAVVDFIRDAFMQKKLQNTQYHTAQNGWANHQKYSDAFPFALGEIAIDLPWQDLTAEQQLGKRIYMASCITCHDRAKVIDEGVMWELRAISYPRNQYTPGKANQIGARQDTASGASAYAKHDIAPVVIGLTQQEEKGQRLFQANCSFCHAADGSGKNWIGSFLSPHPRDLTAASNMSDMTHSRLRQVIRDGLPGTTMSAWKNVLNEEQIEQIIAYINRVLHRVRDDH